MLPSKEKMGSMEFFMTKKLLTKVLVNHLEEQNESFNCNDGDSAGNESNLDYHHSLMNIVWQKKRV